MLFCRVRRLNRAHRSHHAKLECVAANGTGGDKRPRDPDWGDNCRTILDATVKVEGEGKQVREKKPFPYVRLRFNDDANGSIINENEKQLSAVFVTLSTARNGSGETIAVSCCLWPNCNVI